jgi:hypothetical protein
VVTRKTIPIPVLAAFDPSANPKVSLANNGANNFSFFLGGSVGPRQLVVAPVNREGSQSGVLCGGSFYAKALALGRGATIGPVIPSYAGFSYYGALIEGTNVSNGSYYPRGFWGGNLKNQYLGVRFQLHGKTHYGWIRLTVTVNTKLEKPTLEATITGYAYETIANKPIKAGTAAITTAEAQIPSPIRSQAGPSLGILAAGAEGIPLWRRDGSSALQ